MDKEGGYQIVHGPKLYEIEANNIKILFNGHGDKRLKTTGQRVADNIVDHVVANNKMIIVICVRIKLG
jgi:hypothetical protein